MVSFRFCMGRSLCYALLNFLIKFVKQRTREELAEGHIEPITKLFNGIQRAEFQVKIAPLQAADLTNSKPQFQPQ